MQYPKEWHQHTDTNAQDNIDEEKVGEVGKLFVARGAGEWRETGNCVLVPIIHKSCNDGWDGERNPCIAKKEACEWSLQVMGMNTANIPKNLSSKSFLDSPMIRWYCEHTYDGQDDEDILSFAFYFLRLKREDND